MVKRKLATLLFICLFVCLSAVSAQSTESVQEENMVKAWEAMEKVQVVGPNEVTLINQGKLALPKGFIFVPKEEANQFMRAIGNSDDPDMIGMIMSENPEEEWFICIDYIAAGYIEDDDAKNWDVEELFNSIKEGVKETNKDRKKRGFPEMEVVGWVEKPQYDEVNKRLVWSISSKTKGSKDHTINYNTYVLGREGYLELTLVTDLKSIEAQKPIAAQILGVTEFIENKRYSDFNSSTDKVAEYGLAALVAGAAAKKLGFFALLAAFGVKFAKIIGIVVIAGGALGAKLWKKKKEDKNAQNNKSTTEE